MSTTKPQCEHEGCSKPADARATFAQFGEELTDESLVVREGKAQDLCREHFEQEYRSHGDDWTSTYIAYSSNGTLESDEPKPAKEFFGD